MDLADIKPTINLAKIITTFRGLKENISTLNISSGRKAATIISVTVGVLIFGMFTKYFHDKKKHNSKMKKRAGNKKTFGPGSTRDSHSHGESVSRPRSPNIRSIRRQGSILSGVSSASEAGRLDFRKNWSQEPDSSFTPQQLGVMGMEALEMSITYWEDAMAAYSCTANVESLTLTSEEESEFCKQLQKLLEAAYRLQDECELLFLDQKSVLFRPCGSTKFDSDYDGYKSELSPADSFVSAQDEGWQMADLREFDEYVDLNVNIDELSLYQSALKHFEENGIPYRCLRTELLRCSSDVEYLCKLHCVRIAFQWLLQDEAQRSWITTTGRKILTDLLLCANKDPKEFLLAYEDMLTFLEDEKCWQEMEYELTARGVKAMTFYDIVLDYILMDAFEDLDTPPSSVLAVVQNRWLSNGFKESALATAVWSVLRAKRRMLKNPKGFMAHFYSISEKISPLMAWGFLGPDEELKETCLYFKEQVLSFLSSVFSFHCCRYTRVEDLAEDIMKQITTRIENTIAKLSEKVKT